MLERATRVVNAVKEIHAEHWPVLRQSASDSADDASAALAGLSLADGDQAKQAVRRSKRGNGGSQ
jgi:hypothetical protein